jgi:vacuolar-type H+-ATPase subunit B/Vma2
MSSAVRPGATLDGTDGSLSRLLETEALLAERLAAAQAEAARIREAARTAAHEASADDQRVIATAREAVEREYAERREARLSAIEAEKVRRVEALRALPDGELDRLATELVERMLRQVAGTAP